MIIVQIALSDGPNDTILTAIHIEEADSEATLDEEVAIGAAYHCAEALTDWARWRSEKHVREIAERN